MKSIKQDQVDFHQYSLKFAPQLLHIQQSHPSPMPRVVLGLILLLITSMIIWACLGKLDVVAVAEGKLVPASYLKIIQPAEAGIVERILVVEGQTVRPGQVLVEMDAHNDQADSATVSQDLQYHALTLRRIEAELSGRPFMRAEGEPLQLFDKVNAVYVANLQAHENDVVAELSVKAKAQSELAAALEQQRRLEQILPTFRDQEEKLEGLSGEGYATRASYEEVRVQRIENERNLEAQKHSAQAIREQILHAEKHLFQIRSDNRKKLESEKSTIYTEMKKLEQVWAKQTHKNSLLQLKAPQQGVIKDLATHTPGTVVSPGTVLMTLVPVDEALNAEVWVDNEDAGFVHPGQSVKLKVTAYPFQKYGMVDARVLHVSADATDTDAIDQSRDNTKHRNSALAFSYKTLVQPSIQELATKEALLKLHPGMQVTAEIKLKNQTVMEYLLSPVREAFHEAARER